MRGRSTTTCVAVRKKTQRIRSLLPRRCLIRACAVAALAHAPAWALARTDARQGTEQAITDPRHHETARADMFASSEWVPSWLQDVQTARRDWELAGYRLDFFLTVDASWNAIGSVSPGAGAVRELFDGLLTVDSLKAFGYPGGTWHVGLQGIVGDDGSRDAGVLMKYSNIDEPDDRLQVHRFYYEHS